MEISPSSITGENRRSQQTLAADRWMQKGSPEISPDGWSD
jgi:hypothetical protein